ncbi:hypothetical protein HS088_TW21G00611 [Tripterygium wilfordii]|uniref:DEK-C domain-containing protein n=1 Tax=Tripterygium wilfordii TaxID=458696 RepID=A0A7J7C2T4_TRIWF|nr:glutamic acid-rich protein-like [Tripterygium wilfordii]XP_038691103.1 glutamic acid-rich protein-like [Tripterygium wilfordii]KAF5728464.1 hypothetical protein HS088_TW21G00611 [Tripterygium wilfordii]
MGEGDSKTEVPDSSANGNCMPDKVDEVVTKKEQESDGVEEMEEVEERVEKVVTEKMDDDQHTNEGRESNGMAKKVEEEKENPKAESIEKDSAHQDTEEEEEPKAESMEQDIGPAENRDTEEKEEAKEEAEEKVDGSGAEEEEKVDASNVEQEKKTENNEEEKGPKKRGKERSGSRKKGAGAKVKDNRKAVKEKEPEQRTPATDRPVRERKSVERLVASIERDAVKDFLIEKGRGIPLKDIPNVAFKLSRRKIDDTFKLLHSILFARRGKVVQIKSNISRFSGFVWHENEEKQKTRVKEKLDKCNKEKLLEFCDILDIFVAKATTKKEDIITKLMDFLVAPHATTDVLLAEKEKPSKGQKRKRVTKTSPKSGIESSKRSAKSSRKSEDASKSEKKSSVDTEDSEEEVEEKDEEEQREGENGNNVTEKSDDEMLEHSASEEKDESEDNSEEDTRRNKSSSKSPAQKKVPAGKSRRKVITVSNKTSSPFKRTPKMSSSKRSKADDESDARTKVSSRKKIEKVVEDEKSTPRKSASKEKTGKNVTKRKEKAKVNKPPSDGQLRDAICDILKEVDFNMATFTDILKQLAGQFNTDLTPRKSSIKLMIQEELTKLADEVDDEDGEDAVATGQENEASPAEVKVQ